ncbi:MAG TPA: hypothetical protein VJS66_03210, partial [Burkholderiales bacterium]|nr:hypothetical protein [Burkholderiales bacterium]
MGAQYEQKLRAWIVVAGVAVGLTACSAGDDGGGSAGEDSVPVAYVKRSDATLGNPTDSIMFSPGGDLFLREVSSPGAAETNVTSVYTRGNGDVSDPDVSYDGKKIVFAMRCAAAGSPLLNGVPACTNRWEIWEYNLASKQLRPIRCDAVDRSTTPQPITGDDVDPAYLPDGGIVFTSNRQAGTWRKMQENGETPYKILDEYEREPVTLLHVMDEDGRNCQQISFNQSHDRNPTVLPNGKIMFSRWDHVGDRNHFKIFQTNPD